MFFLECGASFTSKLEGMFRDMELSKDFMIQFKQVSLLCHLYLGHAFDLCTQSFKRLFIWKSGRNDSQDEMLSGNSSVRPSLRGGRATLLSESKGNLCLHDVG